jgi:Flp pilus assembly protein TadB
LATEAKTIAETIAASATDRAQRAEEEKARLERELEQSKTARVGETARMKRLVAVVVVAAVMLIALVVLLTTGVIRSWGIYVAVLGAVWYTVAGVQYVTSTSPGKELLLGSIGDSIAMALAWVLGRIH